MKQFKLLTTMIDNDGTFQYAEKLYEVFDIAFIDGNKSKELLKKLRVRYCDFLVIDMGTGQIWRANKTKV